jgi:flagellar biosynthetic protein FliR
MLQELLPNGVWVFLLVFARFGTIVMLLPGFGEAYVSPPVRLGAIMAMTLVVAPTVAGTLPPLPAQPLALFTALGFEVLIGLFYGTLVRLLMSALQIAGNIIAMESGLGQASFFDPSLGEQTAAFGTLLALLGVVTIFTTDLHHMLLRGAMGTYQLMPPGGALPVADLTQAASRFVAGSFMLGVQIAAPFIVYGLIFNTGLGLLQRLMPALQMFTIVIPIQIFMAFGLLALTLGAGMSWFLNHMEDSAAALLPLR